jgi:tetratricopeptide (TPR) repeat protein
MATRRWYAPILVIAVAAISIGAAVSIPSIRGWRMLLPFAPANVRAPVVAPITRMPHAAPAGSVAVAPLPPAGESAGVAKPASSPARTARPWSPSDRQQLKDRVYLAGKDNRPNDAIAALENWDAQHPGDPEVLRELARLLARSPRAYDAFSRYRELLALHADAGVRAEYAGALLATRQYDSAAANYRILIAVDSADVSAHVGLARSLAWNNHQREAEPELHWLVPRLPSDTTLLTMLRLARGSYDPGSTESAAWVLEDPTYSPYRLALGRAYVREGRADRAMAQFDTVLAADPHAPLSLFREGASVHASAGDSIGGARLLGRAVALAPNDPATRNAYAEALSWSGNRTGAIAQYDTLLMAGPDADLLLARGRLHAWAGDGVLAERDLESANAIRETPAAWVMLGDLARWRGDHVHARAAYDRAIALHPGEPGALLGFDAIAEANRREVEAILARELGWSTFASYLGDNAGFSLSSEGVSGGLALGARTALTLGADARRLDSMNGEAGRIGLVDYLGSFRLTSEGGIAHYAQLGDFGFGSVSAAGPWARTWVSAEVRTGPAYQSLMSSGRLTYSGTTVSLTVPIGTAAFSGGIDQMWLSDGNARTSLQIGARYPLGYGVSALYAGGMIGFNHASELYWDPRRFTSHAVGLELSTHRDSGLSFSARVLPGISMGTGVLDGAPEGDRNAAQLSSGFALDYRRRWWMLTLDGDYAQGVRQSGYHSARASVRVRISP